MSMSAMMRLVLGNPAAPDTSFSIRPGFWRQRKWLRVMQCLATVELLIMLARGRDIVVVMSAV